MRSICPDFGHSAALGPQHPDVPVRLPGMASVSSSAQPNVPGRGVVASYSARFWMLVVLIGGAAVLAASMQAPLAAVVLLLELTHKVDGLMVPMLLAVVEATVLSRLLRALDLLRLAPGQLRGRARSELWGQNGSEHDDPSTHRHRE